MNVIVAVDNKWGIGKNNDLLFHLPEDMNYFKEKTLTKVIVMGSNTLLSFPGAKPLKNRVNIVLWPDGEKRSDCIIAESLDELSAVLKQYPSEDVFIVGGAMFYKTMLPFCDTAFITKVDADGDAAVFFENLDNLPNWELISCSETLQSNGFSLKFCTYKNNDVKSF